MLENTKMLVAPIEIFPDINWFRNYSDNKSILYLSNEINSHKGFHGNRFKLSDPNKIRNFSIPLQRESIGNKVSELLISNQSKWFKELKNAIQTIYGKTPFFEYYDYKLWDVFENQKSENFLELATGVLEWSLKALQWDSEIKITDIPSSEITNKKEIIPYKQPFEDKYGFINDLPIFDLIFCMGPESFRIMGTD